MLNWNELKVTGDGLFVATIRTGERTARGERRQVLVIEASSLEEACQKLWQWAKKRKEKVKTLEITPAEPMWG